MIERLFEFKQPLRNYDLKSVFKYPAYAMLNLTKEQITEIADLLDSGMRCFYNRKTGEIKEIPDFDINPSADANGWQDVIDELNMHFEEYVSFKKMSVRETFRVMEEFIAEVGDEELKRRLVRALNKERSFRYFQHEIDYHGEHRERWFVFKAEKYFEYVESQVKVFNELEALREAQNKIENQEDNRD
jgi:hypothetical protein